MSRDKVCLDSWVSMAVLTRLYSYSLAWCELYLFFGYLFRKLHMTLHETTYVEPKKCQE